MGICPECGGVGWYTSYSHTDSSQVIGEKHSFTHFETVPKDYLEVVKKGQKAKIAGLVPLNQVGYFKQEVNEEERTVTTKWIPYISESK